MVEDQSQEQNLNETNAESVVSNISEENKKTVNYILNESSKIKQAQDDLKEDKKALADRMGIKPAELNKALKILEKEREEGGCLVKEQQTLDLVEQLI